MKNLRIGLFAALILAYIATRLWQLTDSCLWFDEIYSVNAAEHSWSELFSFVALDLIHPPLFYVLLKIWIGVGGESLLWLRLFPVIFAVAALVPMFGLFRVLGLTESAQYYVLFFLTVSGSLLKYSQELRMYSLLFFLSLVSLWLLVRTIRSGGGFVPLLLVNLLLIYTHYFGWFFVLGEIAALVILVPKSIWRVAVMLPLMSIAFAPWLIAVVRASAYGEGLAQNIGGTSRPGPVQIAMFLLNLVQPFYYQVTTIEPTSNYWMAIPILLVSIICLAVLLYKFKTTPPGAQQAAKLLAMVIFVPVALAFVGSWLFTYSFWGTRHMIVIFVPVYIIIGLALERIPYRAMVTAVLVLCAGAAFVVRVRSNEPQPSWCAWKPLADAALTERPSEIYASEDLIAYHLWFAEKGGTGTTPRIVKLDDVPGIAEDKGFFLPRGFDEVQTVRLDSPMPQRFWFFYRGSGPPGPADPIAALTARGYYVSSSRWIQAAGETAYAVLLEKR
jgi:hypothetical protein